MNIIFIVITLLWVGEFLVFPSSKKEEQSRKKSFSIILGSILFIITLNAIMYFANFLLIDRFFLKVIALILYGSGLFLRYWSLILLGKNFSRDVEVSDEQELISHGIYKHIRHPLYLGLFLLTIAVPLYVGNILVFLLSIVLMFISINIRIKEEEAFMEEILGERYLSWKNQRYKFIPFFKCNEIGGTKWKKF